MSTLKKTIKAGFIYLVLATLVGSTIYFATLFFGQKPLHVAKKQWNPAKASDQGIDESRLKQAADYIESRLPLAQGLIIIKDGKTVLEKYYWRGGPQEKDYLHSLNGVVLHALVGIAIEQKILTDVNQPLADFFPNSFKHFNGDAKKLTVEDLLKIHAPTIWGDNIQDYWELFYAKDKVSASLATLVSTTGVPHPAAKFAANFLLATIIEKVTSSTVFEYANVQLFKPLGISTYDEINNQNEYQDDFLGFRLKTLDLAKLGYLILHKGSWQGVQLIPQEWVEKITTLNPGEHRDSYGSWKPGTFNGLSTFTAKGDGGQYIVLAPNIDLVIAISSKSQFPLSLISGYDTLIKLIMNSVGEISSPEESARLYSDQDTRAYFEPNFIFTTSVPDEIRQFFIRFSKDIASNDIHKVAFHYAKGYWSAQDGFRTVYETWGKIFNGGSGELESVQIHKIRIDKNRAYLRGLLKLSYMNMNEGSIGWFPLENLIKLNGRWLWLGSPDHADILDRDEYFDAELSTEIHEFINRCGQSFLHSSTKKENGCFSKNFNVSGLTPPQLQKYLQPFTADRDVKLHITKVETSGKERLVEGYLKNSLIGDLNLPPFMRIVQENGQWRWAGNDSH